jgi:hypothetical protein
MSSASDMDRDPHHSEARYECFESIREYERMTDELIGEAQRSIRVFDKALSCGWNTRRRQEQLRAFLRESPTCRLFVLVHEPEAIERLCPRFTLLRQQFCELVQLRVTRRWVQHVHDPFIIIDVRHYLHRFHYDHLRFARGLNDPEGVQQLLGRFGELWDASTPARGGSVMGL